MAISNLGKKILCCTNSYLLQATRNGHRFDCCNSNLYPVITHDFLCDLSASYEDEKESP